MFGVKARQIPCLTGKGEPSNELALKIGLLYINEDNGDMYKCVRREESLVWVLVNNENTNSGKNVELDTTLTQSGKAADAKATGDALAKVGRPTDEQVAAGVEQYISKNPGVVTSVADGSITPGKTDFLEIRTAVESEELTWVSTGYNMLANDGYLDIRGVETITIVHRNPSGSDVAVALYAEDQSQIQAYTVVSGPENQQKIYDENDVITTVTKLDVATLTGGTAAAFAKVRVQQNTNNEYALAVYLGDVDAPVGYTWSDKYGVPQFPDGGVTLRQTNFIEVYGQNLFDTSRFDVSGYSGTLFEQYGASITVFADYIDVSEKKTFYIRARFGAAEGQLAQKVGCYDADKNFISSDGSLVTVTKMRVFSDVVVENSQVVGGGNTIVHRYTVDDSVKFVRISGKIGSGNAGWVAPRNLNLTISSYEDILDMTSPPEQYWRRISPEWRNAILDATGSGPKTMVMIGDSLTNWGGGGDGQPGFLQIVHDKTGIITSNEGTAGAWWQTGLADDVSAVGRVNKIIADGRKYDVYCFLMGTNAGANIDTGETSADTSTMPGAIRYCLEKLKTYDPTAQILVCLPPQRAEGNENQEKVNEVIAKICAEYSVPTLDIYHRSGIVPNTKIADVGYLYDGLHLGEPGYTVLGNLLAAEVKHLLCL